MPVIQPQTLSQTLVDNHLATPDVIAPCTPEDISAIESKYFVKLPRTYKDFLLAVGRSSNKIFSDVILMYPAICDVDDVIKSTLGDFQPPSSAFIFVLHNDTVLYFTTSEGDDPPIYRFTQGDEAAEEVFPSFSSWLSDYILGEIQMQKNIEELDRRADARRPSQ